MEFQKQHLPLRAKIVERFGTQKAFCESIGMSQQAFSRKMVGAIGFTKDDILLIAKALDISLNEIGPYFYA